MSTSTGILPILSEKDFPSISEIAELLCDLPRRVEPEMMGDGDTPSIDVRLQVWENGHWTLHTGDASYDQDHSGFWGSSCVCADANTETIREIAKDLLDQALEHAYECGGLKDCDKL